MAYPRKMVISLLPTGLTGGLWRALSAICLSVGIFALAGCAVTTGRTGPAPQISPLQLADRTVQLSEVDAIAPTPELLALDAEMRDFVETYTGDLRTRRQRLTVLHESIKSPSLLNIQYEANAEGAAAAVFHRGTANCLSYAHLFVALAREAGLDAQYQWLEVRPQWSRIGQRVAVRLHVNVVVNLRRGEQYMVDIDPLQATEVTGSRVITDLDAAALYHNNIAMDALALKQMELAWGHAVKALELSPKMPHLWVNLGAIYRLAGQHAAAEDNYLYALQLNSRYRSAMNNLLVLYEIEGREDDLKLWSSRVARYRAQNPYYHAWLGDKAGETGNWQQAQVHYTRALKLNPEDGSLQYAMGLIHYQLGEYEAASRYITSAIEATTLRRDVESYQKQLDVVNREHLASTL